MKGGDADEVAGGGAYSAFTETLDANKFKKMVYLVNWKSRDERLRRPLPRFQLEKAVVALDRADAVIDGDSG